MGKIIHQYEGTLLDSEEEVWMAMWLDELKGAGYVDHWYKETKSIKVFPAVTFPYIKVTELKTKIKRETKTFTLLQDLEYTPDFYVQWSARAEGLFYSELGNGNMGIDPNNWFFINRDHGEGWIEVKPNFDQNGKTAKFSIIQKILWNTRGLFVDLIQPEKLFQATFMPKAAMPAFKYLRAPTGKNKGKKGPGDWKTDYVPTTLNEFLKGK
jgi:hypothetical protein